MYLRLRGSSCILLIWLLPTVRSRERWGRYGIGLGRGHRPNPRRKHQASSFHRCCWASCTYGVCGVIEAALDTLLHGGLILQLFGQPRRPRSDCVLHNSCPQLQWRKLWDHFDQSNTHYRLLKLLIGCGEQKSSRIRQYYPSMLRRLGAEVSLPSFPYPIAFS